MHVAKYEKGAVGNLLRHYNRTARHNGNRDIDEARTALNYNLCRRDTKDIDYYRERLSQVKCQNRKDVKTLCDWVVTLPKLNFTERGERVFFDTAYKELARRYGEKNVVSAWVHKDEGGQPHLHFCFIPVVSDKKKHIEKVSAKEVLTRSELQAIHKDMDRLMRERFGRDVGILNGSTVSGNKTVSELKAREIKSEVRELEQIREVSVERLAESLRKMPSLISLINRAVRVSLGEGTITHDTDRSRERGR